MTRNLFAATRTFFAALLVAATTATTASADFFDDFDEDLQLSTNYAFWGAGMVPIIPPGGNPVGFLNEAASIVDHIDWNFSGNGYTTTATGNPPDTFFKDSTFDLLWEPIGGEVTPELGGQRVHVITAGGQVGHSNFQNLIRDYDTGDPVFGGDGIGSQFAISAGITTTTKVDNIPVQGFSSVGVGAPQRSVGIGLRQFQPNPPINQEFVALVGQEDFSNALVYATYGGIPLPGGTTGTDSIVVPNLNLSGVEATIEFYVDATNYSLSLTGQDATTFVSKTVQVIPLTPHGLSLDLTGVTTPYMTARRYSGVDDVDVYFNSFGGVSGLVDPPVGLPGDFDMDGDVDGHDFLVWQRNTAVGSLSVWQNNYGMTFPLTAAVGAVPEPNSVILLGLTALGLFGSRRRK